MKFAGDAPSPDRLKKRASREKMRRVRRKLFWSAYLSAYPRARTTTHRGFRPRDICEQREYSQSTYRDSLYRLTKASISTDTRSMSLCRLRCDCQCSSTHL